MAGDQSRHAAAGLSGEIRHARRALGHEVGEPEPGLSPFATAEDVREWLGARWDHVVAVLRSVDEEVAAELLAEVWAVVPVDADESWCRDLHELGGVLAAALPTSETLATAFRRGAEVFRARGDYRSAAVEGMRELAIRRLSDDPDATVAALESLAGTYRAQGLMYGVVDCADEALELYLLHGRERGVARTLGLLGSLMIEVGRPDSAVNYLTRADKAFDDLPDTPPGHRAEWRVLLGRALWLSGDPAAARRQFTRALALLVGVDEAAAQRVRDLLATPAGADLPGSAPGTAGQDQGDLDQQAAGQDHPGQGP